MCTNLCGDFELREERGENLGKDTARMLQAGAQRAFLLRSLKSSLLEAFIDSLALVPKDALIVCESNSLRLCVQPGVFLFAGTAGEMKPSARAVAGYADFQLAYGETAAAKLVCVEQNADGSLSAHPAENIWNKKHANFYRNGLLINHSNATQGVDNGNI
jgi:hypothetical protein